MRIAGIQEICAVLHGHRGSIAEDDAHYSYFICNIRNRAVSFSEFGSQIKRWRDSQEEAHFLQNLSGDPPQPHGFPITIFNLGSGSLTRRHARAYKLVDFNPFTLNFSQEHV
ncbi:PREDICTED: uncharacterized protein LOC105450195 [Wasmannia auropunctata]|uniref:uncharacterized protein LOC105450195 n=1 Tax=Wasmannia auropunctata TaxID=64793 RepID=UPI0005F083E2|nr:PREDICTED: uncharacterized protein LOC105450195 [Wasmannia auropunctata]